MAIPNVGHVLNGWMKQKSVTTIVKSVVDHEVVETPTVTIMRMNIQPMPPQKVARKVDSQREWKWWTIYIKKGPLLKIDDIITVDSVDYRIESVHDWTEGGFQHYEAIEGFS